MFSVASLLPTSAVSRLFSPIHQNQNDFCRSQGRCRKVCWLDFELSCYSRSLMFWKIWNYIVEKDFRFRLFFTESEFGWNNFGEKLPLENFRWVNQKGWLPRAKLRPLVEIKLARPIRGQDFRWSFTPVSLRGTWLCSYGLQSKWASTWVSD